MAEAKKVLVVDDHFEVLDFLQSMLELSTQDYEVMTLPSAEEGLLELRHNDFDLLITDVRLPGMSGFDLVRRMKDIKPNIPVIMITAYSSEQGQQEAIDLGIHRYFQKPLDSDEMLAAIYSALFGELVVLPDEPAEPEEIELVIPDSVANRLKTLRADTGAARLTLATVSGQILLQIGSGRELNLPKLTSIMARNLDNSFILGQELGGNKPTTIQYHSGTKVDLYIANVGRDYFLSIFFDAQAKRGRIGTIWVFAQRAIKDLLAMLPTLDLSRKSGPPLEPPPIVTSTSVAALTQAPELVPDSDRVSKKKPIDDQQSTKKRALKDVDDSAKAALDLLAPTESDGFFTLDEISIDDVVEEDSFWDEAVEKHDASISDTGAFSFEEAKRQGLIPVDDEQETIAAAISGDSEELLALDDSIIENDVDLDDFWEGAVVDDVPQIQEEAGLTFEEAKRKGLIPHEIDLDPTTDVSNQAINENAKELASLLNFDEGESIDVDSFWDSALTQEKDSGDDFTEGLSFEEAKRQGLFPAEIEHDENVD